MPIQSQWRNNRAVQITIVMIVFALTGTTILVVKNPLLRLAFGDQIPLWARILYYVMILPVYNLVLLFYGFIFGQFRYFLDFEKRSFKKISVLLKKK